MFAKLSASCLHVGVRTEEVEVIIMIASPLSDEHADSFLRTWNRAELQRLFMHLRS